MDIKKILFKTNAIDAEKSLPDAIIYCSKEGKILWVNDIAAEFFETSKMHLLTSKITDFIENAINLIINSIIMHQHVIVKSAGKEIYFEMTSREIEDGYVISLRNSANNLSTKTILQDEKDTGLEKNNFLLNLSNDLKSPIQSIVGFSQAMADGLGGNMSIQQEKYIRIINKNSADLMYFIGKLLELSATEINVKTPDCKTLDIISLAQSVVKFNEQLYKEKEVSITVKAEEGFKKMISSNYETLKSIFQDLLEVILKSVDMGEISINFSNPDEEFLAQKEIAQGNYAMISVSSTAMLLSENDLENMFDPYKIVDSANRKNVLRAIILASVKNMVQTLNGMIWVESQILKNTSFNILIPEKQ